MVIPMCRRSKACRGLGAGAPGVLQRTAELIPNQLRFSAPPTLHPLTTCRIGFGANRIRPRALRSRRWMCAGARSRTRNRGNRHGPQTFSGGTLGVTKHLVAIGLQGYVAGLWLGMPRPSKIT